MRFPYNSFIRSSHVQTKSDSIGTGTIGFIQLVGPVTGAIISSCWSLSRSASTFFLVWNGIRRISCNNRINMKLELKILQFSNTSACSSRIVTKSMLLLFTVTELRGSDFLVGGPTRKRSRLSEVSLPIRAPAFPFTT